MIVTSKFIHPEPDGIKALDQSGAKNKETRKVSKKRHKLKQTRLYIYPNTTTKTLHLLTLGGKKSQAGDIKYCKKIVKDIKWSYDEEKV